MDEVDKDPNDLCREDLDLLFLEEINQSGGGRLTDLNGSPIFIDNVTFSKAISDVEFIMFNEVAEFRESIIVEPDSADNITDMKERSSTSQIDKDQYFE